MLKLPGVGTKLNDFLFITNIINKMLKVTIIYKTKNFYGKTIHKMQNYELHSDTRHPNINPMKSSVDQKLSNALGKTNVVITLNKVRHYVFIDTNQYTGRKVL